MAEERTPNRRAAALPIAVLDLDDQNPRLPDALEDRSQESLIRHIDREYEPIRIGRSIAEHGYFESEPLIVVKDGDRYRVVEGNRRLVALLGLSDDRVRQLLSRQTQWEELARRAKLPDVIPVVEVDSPEDVAPIIGYRHISGIIPWEPFAQARFVSHLVDGGMGFSDVADLVGEDLTEVRSLYRNYAIVREARTKFQLDTSPVESDFGVFTRAMNSLPIRRFIAAPAPADVARETDPIPEEKQPELGALLTWIHGDADGDGRVISESRDLKRLARVLDSPAGTDILKLTGNLEAADEAAGGNRRRLLNRLTVARNALQAASEDFPVLRDDAEVLQVLEEIDDALAALNDQIQDRKNET